ncbi:hypothetical protein DICPUDRAFT_76543 [Dictyostelium purpureum]|uniref:Uncharacterized protein n=1 Tax=Dictyostelium purpureum TaxID=5786 RepID=F0ZDX7_DICPU|nr:uncharacterized protein DICPUDRAFT_76543 [Dictyostelium purpureum]EGC37860.1 hypothetical protein DICPUDRAFT_76543 [Dictyostelium purpureum]|eukprot:XP_003285610.1 hypothetical protein DICPUDRAFT_76543 [Dictyostelium purpureum]
MVGRPKKSEQKTTAEDQISVSRSGRKIIRPGETPQQEAPISNNKKKTNKAKDSDDEEQENPKITTRKTATPKKPTPKKSNKKQQQKEISSDEEVIEEVEEEEEEEEVVQVKPKVSKRKGKGASSAESSSSTSGSNSATKKYTATELQIIQSENRMVYIKFFIFSFLMVLVPIIAFKLVNGMIGDYLGINRQDRVSYAGFASLGGLVSVVAAYCIMAYYEK